MPKENTFYFSHDYNARTDKNIKKLLSKHGYLGYGIFWGIVEDLYNNANALPTDYESIAFDYRVNEDVIISILNDFLLFKVKDNIFSSDSVQRRLNDRNNKSLKAKESALKRWDNANALPTQSDSNANKVKESKVKESKKEETFTADAEKENNSDFYAFNRWLSKNASTVSKMKEPFTEEQFMKLRADYTPEQIKELLLKMHNHKDLNKKNVSANLTFRNWANRNGWKTIAEIQSEQYNQQSKFVM